MGWSWPTAGTHLARIRLSRVLLREDVLLAERRVVVKTDLGVKTDNAAVLGVCKRVDLDLNSVNLRGKLLRFRCRP